MTGPAMLTPDDDAYKAWLAQRQAEQHANEHAKQQAVPPVQPPTSAPTTHDEAEFAAWKAQQEPTSPPRSGLYNAVNTVDNALTAGLGQKFNAAFNAVGDKIRGRDTFAHSFNKNLDEENAGLAEFRTKHPYGAAGLGAVGAVGQIAAAAPMIAAGEVANGLSMGARASAAARTGGALGAVGALGNAPNRGGVGETALTAFKGGALGAAIGGAAVPVSQAIGAGARRVANGLGPVLERIAPDATTAPAATSLTPRAATLAGAGAGADVPVDRATQLMLKRLQRAGLTPQDAISRLAEIPTDKPVSVMEIAGDQSHPLRQLGKWVARTPSTGAGQLRAAIAARAEPLPNAQRVLGDVSDALGVDRTNLLDNAARLKGQQLANAKPSYDAAFSPESAPVPVSARVDDGPTLGELLKRPSVQGAVKFHNDIAAERGETPLTLGKAAANSEGEQTYNTMVAQGINAEKARAFVEQHYGAPAEDAVPLKSLQQIKFKLDDALGFAKRNGQLPDGTPATKAKLGAINDTRRALLGIMTQHSPEYAAGNASWAGDAAMQDAGEQGHDFLQRPIDELQKGFPAMTPGEQAQHNVTAVSGPIRNRVFNTSAVDRAKIFSNPDIQERLQAVTPADRLQALRQKLAVEHQIALTNQQVVGGSDTAENLANDADASGQTAKTLLSGLAMGRPRRVLTSAIKSVVNPMVDSWIHGINESTANALAPKLTAGMQSRQDVQAFLDELATALDRMQHTRGSLPYAGASVGVTAPQMVLRRKTP